MATSGDEQHSVGILASLEHRPVRAPRQQNRTVRRTWPFIMLGALAIFAVLVYALHSEPAAAPPHGVLAPLAPQQPLPVAESERLAAAIVNEALPAPSHTAAHAQAPARAATPPRSSQRPYKRPGDGAALKPVEDGDVARLAALVAHGSATGTDRDIVERYSGAPTDSLVRRCRRLGGAEAALCEARICANAGSDATLCRPK